MIAAQGSAAMTSRRGASHRVLLDLLRRRVRQLEAMDDYHVLRGLVSLPRAWVKLPVPLDRATKALWVYGSHECGWALWRLHSRMNLDDWLRAVGESWEVVDGRRDKVVRQLRRALEKRRWATGALALLMT